MQMFTTVSLESSAPYNEHVTDEKIKGYRSVTCVLSSVHV